MASENLSVDKLIMEIRDELRSNRKYLDSIQTLLRASIIIDLWRFGLKQKEIAQRLGVSLTMVNKILKGMKKPE